MRYARGVILNKCVSSTLWLTHGEKGLFLETKLLGQSTVGALVSTLKVFQMLTASGNKTQKAASRALILAVFIQMR